MFFLNNRKLFRARSPDLGGLEFAGFVANRSCLTLLRFLIFSKPDYQSFGESPNAPQTEMIS